MVKVEKPKVKPKVKIVYHIFTDDKDYYAQTKKEAYKIYKKLCKEHDNVRLWTMEDDNYGEDLNTLDCIERKGDFPR